MIQLLKNWQGLVGSMIGAGTPIVFWFSVEWYKNRKERLYKLEKILVHNINLVIDARNTVNYFIETRLQEAIDHIQNSDINCYELTTAFVPLFSTYSAVDDLLECNTGSNYLDNKIMQFFRMSKDLTYIIDDLRQQFRDQVELNRALVLNKLNPPQIQKKLYQENLEDFRSMVKKDLMEKTINIYLKILTSALVALNIIMKIGINRWKFKFTPSFKYFRNKNVLKHYKETSLDRIEKYLEPKIEEKLKEFKTNFIDNVYV